MGTHGTPPEDPGRALWGPWDPPGGPGRALGDPWAPPGDPGARGLVGTSYLEAARAFNDLPVLKVLKASYKYLRPQL